jgi:hypothetical protein
LSPFGYRLHPASTFQKSYETHICNRLHEKRNNELSVPLFPNMISSTSERGHPIVFVLTSRESPRTRDSQKCRRNDDKDHFESHLSPHVAFQKVVFLSKSRYNMLHWNHFQFNQTTISCIDMHSEKVTSK